jgi:hypothetical protein
MEYFKPRINVLVGLFDFLCPPVVIQNGRHEFRVLPFEGFLDDPPEKTGSRMSG